ncbi:MAG: S8 family serine peptidase [Candidatus Schekmanbacteria bacterium]|nr:S8 family serine peptidase [Candidatus Schekmanbacteria bacterium]
MTFVLKSHARALRRLRPMSLVVIAVAALCGAATSALAAGRPADQTTQVIVKLRDTARFRLRGSEIAAIDHRFAPVERRALEDLNAMLMANPGVTERGRLFQRPADELDRERATAIAAGHSELADLNNYLRAVTSEPAAARALVAALKRNPLVQTAYVEPPTFPAGLPVRPAAPASLTPLLGSAFAITPAATSDYESLQGYLEVAPTGVDARYAWQHEGGRGEGIHFIDVEGGWNITHEDLKAPFYTSGSHNADWVDHGTAVLGEILAQDNGFGVTGIAPDVVFGLSSIFPFSSSANAINTAANQLSAGDVMLIELHRPGPDSGEACACNCSQHEYIAVEYWQADFDAIKAATAKGVVVVEAGGNGGMNLDNSIYGGRFDLGVRDSGAIVVGAAKADGTRQPTCWTSYGSRVDVHGWGEAVVTTGYGDLYNPGDDNRLYTDSFGGTSGASPIVVGAAVALQGVYKQGATSTVEVLAPADVRQTLRDTGTAQGASAKNIGPLPDLRAAIDSVLGE